MAGALLSARGIMRRFGRVVALAPTDIELNAGEVVALGGPNGAGKSTLLAILAGALASSGGEVATSLPPDRIGWMPQRPALYPQLSPRENLGLFAQLSGLVDPLQAVERALAEIGLEAEERRAADLSVGNLQRVNLAIGLLGEPEILLLDEPTASLDVAQRRRLWQLVERLRERGGGVIFASHHFDEARRVADRMLVLEQGRVVYAGEPGDYSEEDA